VGAYLADSCNEQDLCGQAGLRFPWMALPHFRSGLCRNLALRGSPKRKQVERGGAREAALRAARSRADLSHQVVPPAPQRAQRRTPETGALRTHGQWTGLFYIRILTVLYLI
jgi:hypothetical protein